MSSLNIASLCETNRVSRGDGARVRQAIEEAWKCGDTVELDFANVRIASVSFLDEAVGLLARKISLDELKRRIQVKNINPADRKLLNRIVLSRANERDASRSEGSESSAPR